MSNQDEVKLGGVLGFIVFLTKKLWEWIVNNGGLVAFVGIRILLLLVLTYVWNHSLFGREVSYVGYRSALAVYLLFLVKEYDVIPAKMANLLVVFALLPFVVWKAWVLVLPAFWVTRPALDIHQVWLGYVSIYAAVNLLSMFRRPLEI